MKPCRPTCALRQRARIVALLISLLPLTLAAWPANARPPALILDGIHPPHTKAPEPTPTPRPTATPPPPANPQPATDSSREREERDQSQRDREAQRRRDREDRDRRDREEREDRDRRDREDRDRRQHDWDWLHRNDAADSQRQRDQERQQELQRQHEFDLQLERERTRQRELELERERERTRQLESQREAERLERQRLESQRLEAQRLETERLQTQRFQAERAASARMEAARLADQQQHEAARLAAERAARHAFVFGPSRARKLYLRSAPGVARPILTWRGDISNPALSPDGARIAFAGRDGNNWDIYAVNADGSGLKRLTNSAARDFNPSWSADNRSVFFQSERAHGARFAVSASGGNFRRVASMAAPLLR